MVFMPPQHGKSELTTRRLPAYTLGKDPNKRIAVATYSSNYAKTFNLAIQRIVDSNKYRDIFPGTNLSRAKDGVEGTFQRNTEMLEVVNCRGFVKTIGTNGALTGYPVDLHILDDPYKSRDEAMSPAINEAVWSYYINVARMRMHNDTQELVVLTRWHNDDVASRLLEKENNWEVVKFPAIKEHEDPKDPRKIGEPLWPEHNNLQKLLDVKNLSEITFNASYQQDPSASKDILVFPEYEIIDFMPATCDKYMNGLDFGYSADPTAGVNCGFVRGRKDSVFLDEVCYKTGMFNEDIIDAFANMELLRILTACDNAEPKDIADLKRKGLNTAPGKKLKTVIARVNHMKAVKLYVTRRSHNILFELNHYQHEVINGKPQNDVVDKYNHLMDAWGYAYMLWKFRKQIK